MSRCGTGARGGQAATVRAWEGVAFTRSGTALTLTRAQLSTEAAGHDADDALQLVLTYSAVDLVDIIEDLLTTYGGVDPAFLDLAGWATEQSTWLAAYSLRASITTPSANAC